MFPDSPFGIPEGASRRPALMLLHPASVSASRGFMWSPKKSASWMAVFICGAGGGGGNGHSAAAGTARGGGGGGSGGAAIFLMFPLVFSSNRFEIEVGRGGTAGVAGSQSALRVWYGSRRSAFSLVNPNGGGGGGNGGNGVAGAVGSAPAAASVFAAGNAILRATTIFFTDTTTAFHQGSAGSNGTIGAGNLTRLDNNWPLGGGGGGGVSAANALTAASADGAPDSQIYANIGGPLAQATTAGQEGAHGRYIVEPYFYSLPGLGGAGGTAGAGGNGGNGGPGCGGGGGGGGITGGIGGTGGNGVVFVWTW